MMYATYNPEKLSEVSYLITKHSKRETELICKLIDKYGPEGKVEWRVWLKRFLEKRNPKKPPLSAVYMDRVIEQNYKTEDVFVSSVLLASK